MRYEKKSDKAEKIALLIGIVLCTWGGVSAWFLHTSGTVDVHETRYESAAALLIVLYFASFLALQSATGARRDHLRVWVEGVISASTAVMGFFLLQLGLYWGVGLYDADPLRKYVALNTWGYVLTAIAFLALCRFHYKKFSNDELEERLQQLEETVAKWYSSERMVYGAVTERVLAFSRETEAIRRQIADLRRRPRCCTPGGW